MTNANQNAWTGRRVLVLGGTGRIGSLVALQLASLGAKVTVTGRTDDSASNVGTITGVQFRKNRLPEELAALDPRDFDVVINLVAVPTAHAANADPQGAFSLNVKLLDQVITHFAAGNPDASVVVTSSVRTSELGSMYSWSKIAAEGLVSASGGKLRCGIVRLGNVSMEVVAAIVQSLLDGTSLAHLASGWDYLQAPSTLPDALRAALHPDVPSGSIITPIMPAVPIPFLAGCLVGYAAGNKRPVGRWMPSYNVESEFPPLLPDWWFKSTRLMTLDYAGQGAGSAGSQGAAIVRQVPVAVTNFKEFSNDASAEAAVRADIGRQCKPRFGELIEFLEEVGLRDLDSTGRATT